MQPLKTLHTVPQFTELAVTFCPCCGGRVFIKANKNQNAYLTCNNTLDEGGNCAHREQWGQRVSYELRKLFAENGGKRVVIQLPLRPGKIGKFVPPAAANLNRAPKQPANINPAPEKSPGECANGLFGG